MDRRYITSGRFPPLTALPGKPATQTPESAPLLASGFSFGLERRRSLTFIRDDEGLMWELGLG